MPASRSPALVPPQPLKKSITRTCSLLLGRLSGKRTSSASGLATLLSVTDGTNLGTDCIETGSAAFCQADESERGWELGSSGSDASTFRLLELANLSGVEGALAARLTISSRNGLAWSAGMAAMLPIEPVPGLSVGSSCATRSNESDRRSPVGVKAAGSLSSGWARARTGARTFQVPARAGRQC